MSIPATSWSGNPTYPQITADYEKTFTVLKSLRCDVFLGAHGSYYGMDEKLKKSYYPGGQNPFIDPEGYQAYVAERDSFPNRASRAADDTLNSAGSESSAGRRRASSSEGRLDARLIVLSCFEYSEDETGKFLLFTANPSLRRTA